MTHEKVLEARNRATQHESEQTQDTTDSVDSSSQLPTPPNETSFSTPPFNPTLIDDNRMYRSQARTQTSSPSSTPPPEDGDPDLTPFDDVQHNSYSHPPDYPDLSAKTSPTSSIEAELDSDDEGERRKDRSNDDLQGMEASEVELTHYVGESEEIVETYDRQDTVEGLGLH